ncbi:MAG: AMP-binding protein [Gammaproteobacteria bacterium]
MESLTNQFSELGLTPSEITKFTTQINQDLQTLSPEHCWQKMVKELRASSYPFRLHALLYKTIYPDWDKVPAPAWFPDEKLIAETHIAKQMREMHCKTYAEFHQWSVTHNADFWEKIIKILNIKFDKPYSALVDLSAGVEHPKWLVDAKFNIAKSCFQADPSHIAIISQSEQGKITHITYRELDKLSNRIANSLNQYLKKGDRVAIIMPMTYYAVAIYLGVIKAGCAVVAIPDSFAPDEIAMRFRIANVNMVFCQDKVIRDGKDLPFYEKMLAANAPTTIVIPADKNLSVTLRTQDQLWNSFLSDNEEFESVSCLPHDYINILFSSGTTGEPKAIPWDQTTPIKCASDAYFHHDIKPHDVFCWPTNLGWMMGPWLIFASLLNKATIALYEGAPTKQNFGKFIQDTKVTLLGVVPTLVRTWRLSGCMEGLDWSAIKLFTSTAERSNIEDMLYLMSLVNYRPVIEYCGGTEVAGSYITGTLIQPAAPAACTTPTLGLDFVLLDENGNTTNNGEVALIPPSMGFSTELLNKDHHQVYYADMPKTPDGKILRRHGDQAEYYANGFYRLLGRADDTMKLGGIKVSSAEIEATLNILPEIYETAAVAINPADGGPSLLVVFIVLKHTISSDKHTLKNKLQTVIKEHLNPLFKIHDVVIVENLPRTASNKVMRRILRDEYQFHLNRSEGSP